MIIRRSYMRFKNYYTEGRNKWDTFTIKKGDKKWSFINTVTGKRYYIKLNDNETDVSAMQKFLKDILATPGTKPKTKGNIDYHEFAQKVLGKEKATVYIKSGNWEKIRKTWTLGEENEI